MESEFEDQRDAASALESLTNDRSRIGQRITAETWWAAPAQGLGVALIIAAPAGGPAWAWMFFLLSVGVLIGVEVLFRRRSGFSITRPAGRHGVWVLVALFAIVFLACVASVTLALFGLIGWVIAVAATAGVATALASAMYDRVYVAEVRRAG